MSMGFGENLGLTRSFCPGVGPQTDAEPDIPMSYRAATKRTDRSGQ